jgi:hypothetical protein
MFWNILRESKPYATVWWCWQWSGAFYSSHIIDGSNETTIKKIRRRAELIWRNLVLAVVSPRLLRSSVLHLV